MSGVVTLELIEKLRSAQYDLQAEGSMNYVEQHYRKQQYKELEVGYAERCMSQKSHYMYIYMMLKYYENGEQWPDYYLAMDWSEKDTRKRHAQFHHPEDLKRAILDISIVEKDLIDAITYSVLPSFCHYFFTEMGCSYYYDVLRSCARCDIYYALTRLIFASPDFLNFISLVFKPILSAKLGEGDDSTSLEKLAAEIKQAWKDNVDKVPHFVHRVIHDAEDPERLLSESFFDLALTEHGVRIFSMIEYYQTITPSLLSQLRDLLIRTGKASICNELISIITTTAESNEKLFLTFLDKEAVPALFQPYLLSMVDLNAFSAMNIGGSFVSPLGYSAGLYMHEGDKEAGSSHCEIEATMVAPTVEACLRHLLQGADAIPAFAEAPDMSIKDFFWQYLVSRGPRKTQYKRIKSIQDLEKNNGIYDNERRLLIALAGVVLDRTKEIRALSVFTRIQERYTLMDMSTMDIRTSTLKLFDYLSLSKFIDKLYLSFHSFIDYVNNPVVFAQDYDKLYSQIENRAPLYMKVRDHWKELIYGYLTKNFARAFTRYRNNHADCCTADEKIAAHLTTHLADVIRQTLDKERPAVPGKFDVWRCMKETLEKAKERQDLINNINTACCESNPLRKLTELYRGMSLALSFFKSHFPANEEFGGDQLVPITIGFLAICNPPHFASNFAYLKHFIDGVPKSMLSSLATHISSTMSMIIKEYGGVDPQNL